MKKDLFYCRPLKKFSDDGPWYCNMSLGHNTLSSKLKTILQMAGLTTERKTNHSLRATSTVQDDFWRGINICDWQIF